MERSDQFWSAYERLQKTLAASFTLTPKSLSLEAVLSSFLELPDGFVEHTPVTREKFDVHIGRLANTCSWRERSHVRIRARNQEELESHLGTEEVSTVLVMLREAREILSPEDWLLLNAIAAGENYESLSANHASIPALRVRVSRARTKLKVA